MSFWRNRKKEEEDIWKNLGGFEEIGINEVTEEVAVINIRNPCDEHRCTVDFSSILLKFACERASSSKQFFFRSSH